MVKDQIDGLHYKGVLNGKELSYHPLALLPAMIFHISKDSKLYHSILTCFKNAFTIGWNFTHHGFHNLWKLWCLASLASIDIITVATIDIILWAVCLSAALATWSLTFRARRRRALCAADF